MSQKNETSLLIVALLITVGLIGGGLWWFMQSGINLNSATNNSPSPTNHGSNW